MTTRQFLSAFAVGLLFSVLAVYAAYSWPIAMICVITLALYLAARYFNRENFWFVVALTICGILMWFLAKDMMHSDLVSQVAREINGIFFGAFEMLKSNFFSK